MSIVEQVEVRIDLSPEKIADLFWEMSSYEQAKFFLQLSKLPWHDREKQWCAMASAMNGDALKAFKHMSTWAEDTEDKIEES